MFHYQVGSLAEEPIVLAEHLRARELRSAVVIHDKSPVGLGYVSAFELACDRTGVEVVGRSAISPLATEAGAIVDRLRQPKPDALVYLGMGAASRAVAVAKEEAGWDVTVVANSALMFGYARKDWRAGFDGWGYVDTVSEGNVRRQEVAGIGAAGGAVLSGDEHHPHLFRHPAPAALERLEVGLGEDSGQRGQRPVLLVDEVVLDALAQGGHGLDGVGDARPAGVL